MQRSILIATCLFLISGLLSCKTMDRNLLEGDYQSVLETGIRKYKSGRIEDREVELMTTAYNRIVEMERNRIGQLKSRMHPSRWPEIYDRYIRLQAVQEMVSPLLPVYFANGEIADIETYDLWAVIEEAREGSAEFYYQSGKSDLLDGSKQKAREAYSHFVRAGNYLPDYKDSRALAREAIERGMNMIGFISDRQPGLILPDGFEEGLIPEWMDKPSGSWVEFDVSETDPADMDYIVRIRLDRAGSSGQNISSQSWQETKTIQDGFRYVLDQNGNVLKDSLGNDIKEPRYVDIVAFVTSHRQFKTVALEASVDLINNRTGRIIRRIPLRHEVIFENVYAQVNGNLAALREETRRMLYNQPLPFPSDGELFIQARDVLRAEVARVATENTRLFEETI